MTIQVNSVAHSFTATVYAVFGLDTHYKKECKLNTAQVAGHQFRWHCAVTPSLCKTTLT